MSKLSCSSTSAAGTFCRMPRCSGSHVLPAAASDASRSRDIKFGARLLLRGLFARLFFCKAFVSRPWRRAGPRAPRNYRLLPPRLVQPCVVAPWEWATGTPARLKQTRAPGQEGRHPTFPCPHPSLTTRRCKPRRRRGLVFGVGRTALNVGRTNLDEDGLRERSDSEALDNSCPRREPIINLE
jgi:hypothetical protein